MQCGKASVAAQFVATPKCASRPRRSAPMAQAVGTTTTKKTQDKIYIGFEKGDYAPRQGRQGRFVNDDPSKYPQRDEFSGGWSGGEVGLKAFVEKTKPLQPAPASKTNPKAPKPIGRGNDTIYVGFSKEDTDARRQGAKGRVIKDDARKYPQRNELTGGFAGGELGLKTFVEKGDVPLAPPGLRRGQPLSPIIVAGVLGGAALIGGAVLLDAVEVGEEALKVDPSALQSAVAVPGLDDSTRAALQAAVLLTGLIGAVAGGRAIVSAAANSLKEGAIKLGTLAVFWVAVFLAAQFVLSSP